MFSVVIACPSGGAGFFFFDFRGGREPDGKLDGRDALRMLGMSGS